MDCSAYLLCHLSATWGTIYADVWGCLWLTLDILLLCMAMGMAFFELWARYASYLSTTSRRLRSAFVDIMYPDLLPDPIDTSRQILMPPCPAPRNSVLCL